MWLLALVVGVAHARLLFLRGLVPSSPVLSPHGIPTNAGAPADGAQSDHGRATDRRVTGYLNLAADAAHNFTDGARRIDGIPRAHPAR